MFDLHFISLHAANGSQKMCGIERLRQVTRSKGKSKCKKLNIEFNSFSNESGQIQMFSSNERRIEAAALSSEDYRTHDDVETARERYETQSQSL